MVKQATVVLEERGEEMVGKVPALVPVAAACLVVTSMLAI